MPESGGQPQHTIRVRDRNGYRFIPRDVLKEGERGEPRVKRSERAVLSTAPMIFGILMHTAAAACLTGREDYEPKGRLLERLRLQGFDVDTLIERLFGISKEVASFINDSIKLSNPRKLSVLWINSPGILTSEAQRELASKMGARCRKAGMVRLLDPLADIPDDEVALIRELEIFFRRDFGDEMKQSEPDMAESLDPLARLAPYNPGKGMRYLAPDGVPSRIYSSRINCWLPGAVPDMLGFIIDKKCEYMAPRLRAVFRGARINDPNKIGIEGIGTLRELAHLMAEGKIGLHVYELKHNFGLVAGDHEKYFSDVAHTVLAVWNLFATWADPKDLPGVLEAMQAHLLHVHVPCIEQEEYGGMSWTHINMPDTKENSIGVFDLLQASLKRYLYEEYLSIVNARIIPF